MSKQIFFVGQAPPAKATPYPFERSRLYSWFQSINLSKEKTARISHFDAVLNYFPGKSGKADKVPNRNDVLNNQPRLYQTLIETEAKLLIPVGKVGIQATFNIEKSIELKDYIGQKFDVIPFGIGDKKYPIIPLPHPSGLSTWIFQDKNQSLLELALENIASVLEGFREGAVKEELVLSAQKVSK